MKMPEPITAPMPSAVSDHGPSVFFSRCSGSSDSEISLSMDLHAKSWFARCYAPGNAGISAFEFKQKARRKSKSKSFHHGGTEGTEKRTNRKINAISFARD